MAVGRFFFSAAPTAKNIPELHLYFIHEFFYPNISGKISESIERFRQIIDATRLDLSTCHISREFGFTVWLDQFKEEANSQIKDYHSIKGKTLGAQNM